MSEIWKQLLRGWILFWAARPLRSSSLSWFRIGFSKSPNSAEWVIEGRKFKIATAGKLSSFRKTLWNNSDGKMDSIATVNPNSKTPSRGKKNPLTMFSKMARLSSGLHRCGTWTVPMFSLWNRLLNNKKLPSWWLIETNLTASTRMCNFTVPLYLGYNYFRQNTFVTAVNWHSYHGSTS